ncbi:very-long-chain 3-oxoacyl-CoA reductase-like protein At1g24470 isoform X1 [Vigna radiata var. radiata]|uniref:Very-long-chain 3-oxoacyl-CoA reductase-like protein At1g24470 isoform X1 n=1 Tax=Vigna radiata var. radiata TaxID=3916 RepID=A0A1S3UQN1_VIGRR|nr:very-long-chain 3-oxoacyl-CoA reductase-like protein At1g24470 isoform X1 [Vigna radiata var. radiata]
MVTAAACNRVDDCVFIVSCLGFIVTLHYLLSLSAWIFRTCFRSEKNLIRTYGSWAVVTGATDGIGKAFACQLAERGLNLILVSRTLQKLEAVAREIKAKNPKARVKVVAMDFACGDLSEGLRRVEKASEGLDVGLLVNNVGVTYPKAMFFDEVEESVWMKIVRVNVEGTTKVTKCVLRGMLERRKGAIVNIGSGAAAVLPSHPLFTVYAATKAYVEQFSRSLYVEYRQYGIHVQCQVPLYVATKMVSKVAFIEKDSVFIPTAEAYARAAIAEIGYKPKSIPYWAHSVQGFFAHCIPNSLLDAWRFSIGVRRRNNHKSFTSDVKSTFSGHVKAIK